MFFIRYLVFLLAALFTNTSFAADDLNEKTIACASDSHDLIKGYKLDVVDSIAEKISISLCDGSVITPDKADEQGGVSKPQIANDKKTIGWNIDTYCCSSGLNSTYLNIYKDGKIYKVSPEYGIVWDWHFSTKSGKVIIKSGYPHGSNEYSLDEFDIITGKKIRHIKDGKK